MDGRSDRIVKFKCSAIAFYKSKVTPGTYFDSFYFISCSNAHNCNIHNTLHMIYQLHTNQLHTNQDAESVSILHTQATK